MKNSSGFPPQKNESLKYEELNILKAGEKTRENQKNPFFFFGFDACFDGKYDIMQSNKGKRLLIRIPQEKKYAGTVIRYREKQFLHFDRGAL